MAQPKAPRFGTHAWVQNEAAQMVQWANAGNSREIEARIAQIMDEARRNLISQLEEEVTQAVRNAADRFR